MGGQPMIARVADSLAQSNRIGRILVSIESPEVLRGVPQIDRLIAEDRLCVVESRDNLFLSIRAALDAPSRFPALICTADNALQTTQMVDHFCTAFEATGAGIGVGMTRAETIWARYPEGQLRPYRFRDGQFSNCNLFALADTDALGAARAFEGGGQFGKSALRILNAFGPVNLVLYKSGLLSTSAIFARLSRRFGTRIMPVDMPFAEAPIDVDNARTERIAREILAERETGRIATVKAG